MTRKTTREARAQLLGMLAIAAAATVAYWIGEGAAGGLQAGALLFGFALLVYLGRRWSGTIETMSGVGDERTRALTQRAAAFAGYAMSCVLAAWGLISAALGAFNVTVGALSVVFALTWVGACAWLSHRG